VYILLLLTDAMHTGVLAGIWPCGVISLLSELYIAESKTQVYGAVHDFIQRNNSSLQDLSKLHAMNTVPTVEIGSLEYHL
jgi:hypothetical protein